MYAQELEETSCCDTYEYKEQRFCLDKSGKFEVWGDYLYWEAREDQLTYAQDLNGGINSLINPFQNGNVPNELDINISTYDADFNWKSGFRVGAGYYLNCNNWDFQIFWTRLHETTNANITDLNSGIIPSNIPLAILFNIVSTIISEGAIPPVLASGAHNKWHFHFDNIDFQVGKSFYNCCNVAIRPFVGVKGAWIDQKLASRYDGVTLTIETNAMPIGVNVKKTNNFHAVGPSLGIGLAWQFFSDFSLIGDFSFATLYGKFQNRIRSTLTDNTVGVQVVANIRDNKHRFRPMVAGNIGVEWNNCCWDCAQFILGISYEVQYWWNQWQIPSSAEVALLTGGTSPQGDLSLQGLTVHAGVAF